MSVALILHSVIKGIFEGEEGRLKRLIYSAKRAVERENFIKCASYVSFDYEDKHGNDRNGLFLIVRWFFGEYDNIFIKITELEIEVTDQNALAEIEAVIYGRRDDSSKKVIFEYDKSRFKVEFKKEQGNWKVIGLEFFEPEDVLSLPGIT